MDQSMDYAAPMDAGTRPLSNMTNGGKIAVFASGEIRAEAFEKDFGRNHTTVRHFVPAPNFAFVANEATLYVVQNSENNGYNPQNEYAISEQDSHHISVVVTARPHAATHATISVQLVCKLRQVIDTTAPLPEPLATIV